MTTPTTDAVVTDLRKVFPKAVARIEADARRRVLAEVQERLQRTPLVSGRSGMHGTAWTKTAVDAILDDLAEADR